MRTFAFEPCDTLFFRDGRPFNQDDPGQADMRSLFPPHPPTMVGAFRAAVARALGWTPDADWSQVAEHLGDGVNWQADDEATVLGPLRFAGPFVAKGGVPYLPAPADILYGAAGASDPGAAEITRLVPGPERASDLADGRARLPVPLRPGAGWKRVEGCWIAAPAFERVLAGEVPEPRDLVAADDLWRIEGRVGIGRDPQTRTAAHGQIFATAQVRLHRGVCLALQVEGLADGVAPANPAPLGGEHRFGWLEERAGALELPDGADVDRLAAAGNGSSFIYTVTLLTPADLGDRWPGPSGSLGHLPGKVVSACCERPVPVGGWDTQARRPLPLRPLAPAGSVWFLEAAKDKALALAQARANPLGRSTAWGFGRFRIGLPAAGGATA